MHTCVHTRRKSARARFVARMRKCTSGARMCAWIFTKKKIGKSLLSYELKYKILKRSELSFWRYLQNNTDF